MPSGWLRFSSFVRALRGERDRLGQLLLALIALHVAAVCAIGVSPTAARFFMRRFQLDAPSFPVWALYAAGPWMYNFENAYLVSPEQLTAGALEAPPAPLAWWAINHQSARVVTFGDHRPGLLRVPGERYVYLRSRYRGSEVTRALRLTVSPGARPYRARVAPLEVLP
ncbi:MAG: hypothetical protein ABW252_14275 [Polyangiales bacterium]